MLSRYLQLLLVMLGLLFAPVIVSAEETSTDESTDIVLSDESVDDITDEELTEAEPSDVPEVEEDEELAEDLAGEMLLDVEGNGEVYYVDPVDGGKEYLADGESAHRLLERSALGINEENFALLVQGQEKDEASVCEENDLGKRLRGRIVLRVEKNGEAWWIFPRNCRAYYVGTHEAAYELMREFSLGINKQNLGKIRDTKRQALKKAVRYSVYQYAEENDVSLEDAREVVKTEAEEARQCFKDSGVNKDSSADRADKRTVARQCLAQTDLPEITKEAREKAKERIQQVREMNKELKAELREIRIDTKKKIVEIRKDAMEDRKDVIKDAIEERKENRPTPPPPPQDGGDSSDTNTDQTS